MNSIKLDVHEGINIIQNAIEKLDTLEKENEDLLQVIDLKEQALFKKDNEIKEYQDEILRLSNATTKRSWQTCNHFDLENRIINRLKAQHYKIKENTFKVIRKPIIITEEDNKQIDADDIEAVERSLNIRFELMEVEDEDRGMLYSYEIYEK
jgi:hypothetical protein